MVNPKILHIETATNVCSVAVSEGENLLSLRESDIDKSHGSLLTVFMDEVLKEAGLRPTDLQGISVSKGPGSYTGLRIGVSATKGFAFGLNLPILGIDTLLSLAIGAKESTPVSELIAREPELLLCPQIDARRMEVFCGFYRLDNRQFRKISADIIEENSYDDILEKFPVAFFGNGSEKVKGVITHSNAHFIDGIQSSARFMIPLALELYNRQEFENSAYFEPFYLKDFVATIPKRKLL